MPDFVSSEVEVIRGRHLELFREPDAIAARVREIGEVLTNVYQGKCPVVIGIMHGAFMFTADLVRAIKLPCIVDFWRLSSYGSGTMSGQPVQEIMSPTVNLHGQHIILVEDIVDTGRTLTYVRRELVRYTPKSVTTVSLVKVAGSPVKVDHAGFISRGDFIVGYGLDIAHELRGLPALYYLQSTEHANEPEWEEDKYSPN